MTARAATARWEVGSEFDWRPEYAGPPRPGAASPLPAGSALFSTGRSAILAIARQALGERRGTLHLPSYFCPEVAEALAEACDLGRYGDLPTEPSPRFESLRPAPGDLVLAVNFFGSRDGAPWASWAADHPDVLVIEDHTHDPASPWARGSAAPYAVAALRKTLPIPDGAIAWSPRGLPLPEPAAPPPAAALEKLAAMVLKRAYLDGGRVDKDAFRALQIEGERGLGLATGSAGSAFSRAVLGALDVDALNRRRAANARRFLERIADLGGDDVGPLCTEWPAGATPYNPVLVCRAARLRDELRDALRREGVYCAVHWPQPDGEPDAVDLAGRVLTVPLDHRYGDEDVIRVASLVDRFLDHRPRR